MKLREIASGPKGDCPSVSCEVGLYCTRDNGHEGPHAAHAGDDEAPFAVWDDGCTEYICAGYATAALKRIRNERK